MTRTIAFAIACIVCTSESDVAYSRDRIGTVLGEAIYRDQLRLNDRELRDELRRLFIEPLVNHYKNIHPRDTKPSASEVDSHHRYLRQRHKSRMNQDEPELRQMLQQVEIKLQSDKTPETEKATLLRERRVLLTSLSPPTRMASEEILEHWKLNKHLYLHYGGGRILYQQGGMEAYDATYKWIISCESKGQIEIIDREMKDALYGYWTKDEDHGAFLINDKQRIQSDFLEPAWFKRMNE